MILESSLMTSSAWNWSKSVKIKGMFFPFLDLGSLMVLDIMFSTALNLEKPRIDSMHPIWSKAKKQNNPKFLTPTMLKRKIKKNL